MILLILYLRYILYIYLTYTIMFFIFIIVHYDVMLPVVLQPVCSRSQWPQWGQDLMASVMVHACVVEKCYAASWLQHLLMQ